VKTQGRNGSGEFISPSCSNSVIGHESISIMPRERNPILTENFENGFPHGLLDFCTGASLLGVGSGSSGGLSSGREDGFRRRLMAARLPLRPRRLVQCPVALDHHRPGARTVAESQA
jgi:hypothetical protein